MEGLFCQQTLSTPTPTSQSSPRASRSESADKRKDVTSEVSITVLAKDNRVILPFDSKVADSNVLRDSWHVKNSS